MRKIFEIYCNSGFVKVHHFPAFGKYRVRMYKEGESRTYFAEYDNFYDNEADAVAQACRRIFNRGKVYNVHVEEFRN